MLRHCTVTKSWSLPLDPSPAQRLDITPTLSTLPWEVYVEYSLYGSPHMLGQVLATDIRRVVLDLMESPGRRRFYHWKSPPGRLILLYLYCIEMLLISWYTWPIASNGTKGLSLMSPLMQFRKIVMLICGLRGRQRRAEKTCAYSFPFSSRVTTAMSQTKL